MSSLSHDHPWDKCFLKRNFGLNKLEFLEIHSNLSGSLHQKISPVVGFIQDSISFRSEKGKKEKKKRVKSLLWSMNNDLAIHYTNK